MSAARNPEHDPDSSKGAVNVISSDLPLQRDMSQFTTVPFKTLFHQQFGIYYRFSNLKKCLSLLISAFILKQ